MAGAIMPKVKCPNCGQWFPIRGRRSQVQSNFTHLAIGRYASAMGMTAAQAKLMFKTQYGIWVPFPFREGAPPWRGMFVEIYPGTPDHRLVFMKSEADYTAKEEKALTEGVKTEAFDAGIDLSDLFED